MESLKKSHKIRRVLFSGEHLGTELVEFKFLYALSIVDLLSSWVF